MIKKYARGMVYWVDLPNWYGENVQTGRRPCIIISNDVGNIFSNNVTVVPCTTNLDKLSTQPTHCKTSLFKNVESLILCESIFTISKTLIGDFIGLLDDDTMQQVTDCIKIALGIDKIPEKISEPKKEPETKVKQPKKISLKETQQEYIKDYDKYGPDYVVKKYNVASKNAAYQRYKYYKLKK